jgi:oxygen-independent coproporphyrinogen-3 oxidase
VSAVQREWASLTADLPALPPLTSLYLGGGTPSLLSAHAVEDLLSTFRGRFLPHAEVTLEANPNDVNLEVLGAWRAAGITRVSLGVQSLDARTLASLGRDHSVDDAKHALQWMATVGFRSWSADLIFGMPRQALEV